MTTDASIVARALKSGPGPGESYLDGGPLLSPALDGRAVWPPDRPTDGPLENRKDKRRMHPSPEQIGVAAYHRWERRNRQHGHHVQDWLAAEQELLFAGNYELIASYRLDGVPARHLGEREDRRCRFCEATAPRATFGAARPALPSSLGNTSLFSLEICDDCHDQHEESVGNDLDGFVDAIRRGDLVDRSHDPIAAFKGLARAALAVVPEDELQFFEDAIEWVGNPDHDLDSQSIGGMDCYLHALPEPSPFSWVALARRLEDDGPFPYLLAFFGTGDLVFQIALPLCVRDEDLEVSWIVPRAPSPFGVGRGPIESRSTVIPLASAATRLAFAGS